MTNSSKNEVVLDEMNDENIRVITIKTTATPTNFEANKAVIKILSKYLKIPKSSIRIIHGEAVFNLLSSINPHQSLVEFF